MKVKYAKPPSKNKLTTPYVIANIGNVFKKIKFMAKTNKKMNSVNVSFILFRI